LLCPDGLRCRDHVVVAISGRRSDCGEWRGPKELGSDSAKRRCITFRRSAITTRSEIARNRSGRAANSRSPRPATSCSIQEVATARILVQPAESFSVLERSCVACWVRLKSARIAACFACRCRPTGGRSHEHKLQFKHHSRICVIQRKGATLSRVLREISARFLRILASYIPKHRGIRKSPTTSSASSKAIIKRERAFVLTLLCCIAASGETIALSNGVRFRSLPTSAIPPAMNPSSGNAPSLRRQLLSHLPRPEQTSPCSLRAVLSALTRPEINCEPQAKPVRDRIAARFSQRRRRQAVPTLFPTSRRPCSVGQESEIGSSNSRRGSPRNRQDFACCWRQATTSTGACDSVG